METVNNNNYKQLKFWKAKLRRTRTHARTTHTHTTPYLSIQYIYRRWWPQQPGASRPTPTQQQQQQKHKQQPTQQPQKQANKQKTVSPRIPCPDGRPAASRSGRSTTCRCCPWGRWRRADAEIRRVPRPPPSAWPALPQSAACDGRSSPRTQVPVDNKSGDSSSTDMLKTELVKTNSAWFHVQGHGYGNGS